MAVGSAFDGTNYLVGIQGDSSAEYNITAQLIGPSGAMIGARISTGRTGGAPQVAFDGANYLMIWEDDASYPNDDVYGQRISPAGSLVGAPFSVSAAAGFQHISGHALAYGGGKYLTVFHDNRSGTDSVYGQLILPAGTLSGSVIEISADTLAALEPSAAFDGTNFLVVWQKRTGAGQEQYDTMGMFITPAGVKGAPFVISQSTSARFNPMTILFNGTNYLVVWNRDVGPGFPAPTQWDIYGRRVSPGGALLGNEFPLVAAGGDQILPSLAFDGVNYLLGWTEGELGGTTWAKLRFFNASAQALGQPFDLFAAQGANQPLVGRAEFDGKRFCVIATLAEVDSNFQFIKGDVIGSFLPASTAQPRLEATGPRIGTQFPLRLTGTPGIDYTLQTGTTLGANDWTPLATSAVAPVTEVFDFTDTQATGSHRFYRAVMP